VTLLRAADVSLSFGSRNLFRDLTLVVEEDERVGLVGVNGSGKSTLMRILAGELHPDAGELQLRRGARVTFLAQEPRFAPGATVAGELSVAQAPLREALEAHHALAHQLASLGADAQARAATQLAALADRIESLGGWDTEHHARTLLDRLGVKDWERPVSELSGGVRKRVAIARALLSRPELLLLDEPTNHLDADTVEWLEDALDALPGSLLLVTHDRYFLDSLVDRVVEIQPGGGLVSYPGNYQAYLEQKLAAEEEASRAEHKRGRWIAQEVAWLRRGPEARRTKSRARIERARRLMAEPRFRRPRVPELQLAEAQRLGHTVLEAQDVAFGWPDRELFHDVSLLVQSGDRVGIVGPNGAGKTTLLRVLLGELPPGRGTVVRGRTVRVAHFDQGRESLDPEQTVYEAASAEEQVELGGRTVALRDYLDDLLFPVPMQRMKVGALSGGERNRLLLARLFLQGANVLVLDEPTNDLDLPTLNVLERLLLGFAGAVLLVTHDRYFLDKVATRIVAVEGDGKVVSWPGNFTTYRSLRSQAADMAGGPVERRDTPPPAPQPVEPARPRRLGYQAQRELDGMEAAIEAAEARRSVAEAELLRPDVYSDGRRAAEAQATLAAASAEVDRLYARWAELTSLG